MKKHLAIIPARSGSKSIIDKNIKEIAGKPLMAYTIEAAVNSGVFAHVLLSTDSEEYARIGKLCGAEVPYLRNPAFARDNSPTWEAIKEGMDYYAGLGETFDTRCLLQVTSPLRSAADIKKGYEILEKYDARSVIGMTRSTPSAEGAFLLSDDSSIRFEEDRERRTDRIQNASSRIFETGTLYIDDLKKESEGIPYLEGARALIMPRDRSCDINEPLDFELAAFLMGNKGYEEVPRDISQKYGMVKAAAERPGLEFKVFDEAALLSAEDIDKALSLFEDGNVKMVMTGTELDISPVLTTSLCDDLSLKEYTNRKTRPRQEYPKHYRLSGGLVLYKKECFSGLPEDYRDYPMWLSGLDDEELSGIKISTVSGQRALIMEDDFDKKVFSFLSGKNKKDFGREPSVQAAFGAACNFFSKKFKKGVKEFEIGSIYVV